MSSYLNNYVNGATHGLKDRGVSPVYFVKRANESKCAKTQKLANELILYSGAARPDPDILEVIGPNAPKRSALARHKHLAIPSLIAGSGLAIGGATSGYGDYITSDSGSTDNLILDKLNDMGAEFDEVSHLKRFLGNGSVDSIIPGAEDASPGLTESVKDLINRITE